MLMEQTPSQQNWQRYNSLKRAWPDARPKLPDHRPRRRHHPVLQLRRSKGACEKFHGAVIAHSGSGETRVFKECSQLGAELKALGTQTIGADNPAQGGHPLRLGTTTGPLEYTSGPTVDLKYVDQIHQYYRYFYDKHIPVDMVPVDRRLLQVPGYRGPRVCTW